MSLMKLFNISIKICVAFTHFLTSSERIILLQPSGDNAS